MNIITEKLCKVCNTVKSLSEFYTNNRAKDKKCTQCKICHNRATQNWREAHPKQLRDQYLKWARGITLEEYNKLFVMQYGKCAICGLHQSESKKSLAVDHNHKTGKIRGLLCKSCNQAIGLFFENTTSMVKAIEYLKQYNG